MTKDTDQKTGPVKTCTKCRETKPIEEYYVRKDTGRSRNECKQCFSAAAGERSKVYRKNMTEEQRQAERDRQAGRYAKDPAKEKARNMKWREENPEKWREIYTKHSAKKRSTARGRLESAMCGNMHHGIKKGSKQGRRAFDLAGYTVDDLMAHLEKQFQPGMTWENYGRGGWHIDHIIPKAAFNYETPDDIDFKRCWSLENLQPLWESDNCSKQNRLDAPFQPSLHLTITENQHVS